MREWLRTWLRSRAYSTRELYARLKACEGERDQAVRRLARYVELMRMTGAELEREAAILEEHLHSDDAAIAAGLRRLGAKMKESGP